MIKTSIFSENTFPVPNEWIFEYILKIDKLTGQTITIKSPFNPDDKIPSMKIFYGDKGYFFKDFSSGHFGDGVHLYMLLEKITERKEAMRKLYEAYRNDDKSYSYEQVIIEVKKEITDYKIRSWNTLDVKYWKKRFISSSELDFQCVKPLSTYTIKVTTNGNEKVYENEPNICYGFFSKSGKLCKIYNPGQKNGKYIKVISFIQGEEQLLFNKPWLIIVSSTKEVLHMRKMFHNVAEFIAPESENVPVPLEKINFFKSKYKYISTLFDNDKAGIKAMNYYKEMYDLNGILFNVEKDIDECVVQHGLKNTQLFLKPVLKQAYDREVKRVVKK